MSWIDLVMAEVRRNWAGNQARRLFHGRGHAFPGLEALNVDAYAPVLVIQVYRDGYEVTALAEALVVFLIQAGCDSPCILHQLRHERHDAWKILHGQLPAAPVALEGTLRYQLRFLENQNIGFFPDMRLGRELACRFAPGARVLNLFAYSCSFSVAVMAAGAKSCLNMDLSKNSLSLGRANHLLNGQSVEQVQFLGLDVLKSFGRINRHAPYDLVIIDPPSAQEGFRAEQHYAKIVRRVSEMMADDGRMLICLNAPHLDNAFLDDLFTDLPFALEHSLGRPDEYVEQFPERGLKIQLRKKTPTLEKGVSNGA